MFTGWANISTIQTSLQIMDFLELLVKKPEQVKKFLPIGRYRLKILQAKIGSKQVIFQQKVKIGCKSFTS